MRCSFRPHVQVTRAHQASDIMPQCAGHDTRFPPNLNLGLRCNQFFPPTMHQSIQSNIAARFQHIDPSSKLFHATSTRKPAHHVHQTFSKAHKDWSPTITHPASGHASQRLFLGGSPFIWRPKKCTLANSLAKSLAGHSQKRHFFVGWSLA